MSSSHEPRHMGLSFILTNSCNSLLYNPYPYHIILSLTCSLVYTRRAYTERLVHSNVLTMWQVLISSTQLCHPSVIYVVSNIQIYLTIPLSYLKHISTKCICFKCICASTYHKIISTIRIAFQAGRELVIITFRQQKVHQINIHRHRHIHYNIFQQTIYTL